MLYCGDYSGHCDCVYCYNASFGNEQMTEINLIQSRYKTLLCKSLSRPGRGGQLLQLGRGGEREEFRGESQALRRLQADQQLRQVPIHVQAHEERLQAEQCRPHDEGGPVLDQPKRPVLHTGGYPESHSVEILAVN